VTEIAIDSNKRNSCDVELEFTNQLRKQWGRWPPCTILGILGFSSFSRELCWFEGGEEAGLLSCVGEFNHSPEFSKVRTERLLIGASM